MINPEDDKWVSSKDILEIITNPKWSWLKNYKCKYIELRIDTRDGHAILRDRYGKIITLDDLKKQEL